MGKHEVCSKALPQEYHDEWYEDNWIGQKALHMLSQRPADQPWYLRINWAGPHSPFIVTEQMLASVANRTYPQPVDYWFGNNTAADHEVSRRTYSAEGENLDRWFGKFVQLVQALGDTNNTLICASSDHGEMLGDHGDWEKSKPWEGASHVPLVCTGPPHLVQGK